MNVPRLWPALGALVTAAWIWGATEGDPLGRAAAAGAAAVVTAVLLPGGPVATVVLGLLPLAVARSVHSTGTLAAVLVPVAVAAAWHRFRPFSALVGVAGAVLLAASLAFTALAGDGWVLTPSGSFVATVALLGALGLIVGRPPMPALVVPAALVGAFAVPVLPHRLAAVLGALVVVAAAALGWDVTALVVLGWAAVVVPGGHVAGLLLLGAGALLAAVPRRLALLAGLPGAVLLVAAVAGRPRSTAGLTVCLAAGAAAALLARPGSRTAVEPSHLPAGVLLGWLAVAPMTWAWAGATEGLARYQSGALLAAAAAVVAITAKRVVKT
ncbi:MAG TPA: hypothetical protein VFA94_01495 [Acidimicrobiales bacterium]|nr:hypothetical protein [Acidimicrobiales bacterium]